jgi:tRNA-dihydrouridine synthase
VEHIDPASAAREVARRGMDPRVTRWVPAFDAPFFQAGLAGYSDAAMRLVARRHGCPFCVTEALLDRMLLGGGRGFDKADLKLIEENLPAGKDDQPLAGQIIGSDPDEMAASAVKMIEQGRRHDREYRAMAYGDGPLPTSTDPRWAMPGESVLACSDDGESDTGTGEDASCGVDLSALSRPSADRGDRDPVTARADVTGGTGGTGGTGALMAGGASAFATIDVNLACPVKKIDRKSRGGHWLSEPQGAIDILRAVRSAVPAEIACTVKLRRAYDDTPEMARNFERIFEACYELGYAWTTVHARTVEQRYVGPSRWTFLKDLVSRHPDKPVFGSGDVWGVADIFTMMAYAGVSGVSVARGCIGNPWIFRQAREMMAGREPSAPTLGEQRAVLLEHFRLSLAVNEASVRRGHAERVTGRMMRKFGIKFAQHHPRPDLVKHAMVRVDSLEDWQTVLDELYPVADGAVVGGGHA